MTEPLQPINGDAAATATPTLRRPKRIIVLCDGTWQMRRSVKAAVTTGGVQTSTSESYFTNVALLGQCILPSATITSGEGPSSSSYVMPQIVYYQDGIGATQYWFSRILEGATGSTLDLKVQEAYSFLVDNYLPGDELFFFGFSRGAYTARSLAAFINYIGIITRAERSRSLSKLWNAFRARRPDKPNTVSNAERVVYDELGMYPSGNAMHSALLNIQGAQTFADRSIYGDRRSENIATTADVSQRQPQIIPPDIQVVGVWDTVGALGVPGVFLNPMLQRYFSFFDPMLAPNVRHAFHAMGLGEDRKDFQPTVWLLPTNELAADAQRRQGQDMRQCWFQGAHSDVGGSHAWHGLSDITFAWMIAQLCDRPKGQPPLLNIDVAAARRLLDVRLSWSTQPQHPSRQSIALQTTRQVCGWQVAALNDGKEPPHTHESIHHSVVVSQKYDRQTSPVFSFLNQAAAKHKDKRLENMWNAASDAATLLPKERQMRWTDDECVAVTATTTTTTQVPKYATFTTDPDIPPQQPQGIPTPVWRVLHSVCYAPRLLVSYIINWKVFVLRRNPLPQQNLKPPLALNFLRHVFGN